MEEKLHAAKLDYCQYCKQNFELEKQYKTQRLTFFLEVHIKKTHTFSSFKYLSLSYTLTLALWSSQHRQAWSYRRPLFCSCSLSAPCWWAWDPLAVAQAVWMVHRKKESVYLILYAHLVDWHVALVAATGELDAALDPYCVVQEIIVSLLRCGMNAALVTTVDELARMLQETSAAVAIRLHHSHNNEMKKILHVSTSFWYCEEALRLNSR